MQKCFMTLCLLFLLKGIAYSQHAVFDSTLYTEYIGSSFDFISTADINNDNRKDIIGVTSDYANNANDHMILVWLQDNAGKLQPVIKTPYIQPGEAMDMVVGDLYGQPSIVIAMENYVAIYVWDQFAKAPVLADSFKTTDSLKQESIAIADFDRNGFADIAVAFWKSTQLTLLYQDHSTTRHWAKIDYAVDTGFGHWQLTSGQFGGMSQVGLISVNVNLSTPLSVTIFNHGRQIQNTYKMQLPASPWIQLPSSAEIVQKGKAGKWGEAKKELWLTYGGNYPKSKVAVWRDTQILPDSVIQVRDIPDVIKSANLDCDDDDEPVILHAGWNLVTVFSDTEKYYPVLSPSHYNPNSLALGDVNNDGKKDVCIAGCLGASQLTILYNITPKCPPVSTIVTSLSSNELLISPNPACDHVVLTYPGEGRLQVHDAIGRSVYDAEFKDRLALDISNSPAGIYFVKLETTESGQLKKKFIKH